MEYYRWRSREDGGIAQALSRRLLRECFRLPIGRRSEVNRGQNGADQHYQQIDFHVTLRCAIAALPMAMQKAFQPFNDIGVIKNG